LRVLTTGATGFVGRHLTEALRARGYTLYGTSYPEEPGASDEKEVVRLDVRKEKEISDFVRTCRPDWVFHLAAVSNVGDSWKRRKETLETNIIGTLNLVEAVRKHAPRARFLFVSSSDVYGLPGENGRLLEEDDDVRAQNPYAYSKLCGENLCDFYVRVENLDAVIARAFPHTGPGQNPLFVCSDWARQIALIEKGEGEPEILVGDISVARDFTDVRDVVRAYLLLMEKGEAGEVYNVCSGKAWSLEEVLHRLISLSPMSIRVRVDPRKLRRADIPVLVGENRKIRERTGWAPDTPFEKTLRELLEYWRRTL